MLHSSYRYKLAITTVFLQSNPVIPSGSHDILNSVYKDLLSKQTPLLNFNIINIQNYKKNITLRSGKCEYGTKYKYISHQYTLTFRKLQ